MSAYCQDNFLYIRVRKNKQMSSDSMLPATTFGFGKQSRSLAAHTKKVDEQFSMQLANIYARGSLVDHEMMVNTAVVTATAQFEMAAAEQMIQQAGNSQVAQAIAANRISRLIQANDKTLNRYGF